MQRLKFQTMSYEDQKKSNFEPNKSKEKKTFKPTPPDFPIENVISRINNQSVS